jgi:hypothetical protein
VASGNIFGFLLLSLATSCLGKLEHHWGASNRKYLGILGLELRAFTLNHSTSSYFSEGFFRIWSPELFCLG